MLRNFMNSRKNLRQRTGRPASTAELLEVRRLPTGIVSVSIMANSDVTINGDNADNNLEIDARPDGFFITGRDGTQIKIKTADGVTTLHAADESVQLSNAPTAGNVVIDMEAGNDTVNFDFESSGGEGHLDVQLTGLSVDMEAGNDTLNLNSYPASVGNEVDIPSLTVLNDLILNLGLGNDVLNDHGDSEIPAVVAEGKVDRLSAISVGRDLKLTGGQGSDQMNLDVRDLTVSGEASIVTGNGSDTFDFSNDGRVVFEHGWKIDTGAGDDTVDLYLGNGQSGSGSLDVQENLSILTGSGADHVDFAAHVPVVIGRLSKDPAAVPSQFLINTSDGDDHVLVEAFDFGGGEGRNGGSIRVQGDFIAKLGSANDCFLAGTQSSIAGAFEERPGEIGIEVTNDVSVGGGAGDDVLGLVGTTVDRDVTINGGNGNDSVGTVNLIVGRNLEVNAGQGNDDLAAAFVAVTGTTNLNMGKNDDRAAVSNLMLIGTTNITLGAGVDQIDVRQVAADPGTIINVDGGSGAGTRVAEKVEV